MKPSFWKTFNRIVIPANMFLSVVLAIKGLVCHDQTFLPCVMSALGWLLATLLYYEKMKP